MPLTVPTWIAAIATVVLALGAIVTSIFAIRAFGKQTQEFGLLEQQVKDQQDERQREAETRRRAQAAQVYLTEEVFAGNQAHPGNDYIAGRSARPATVTATVHNTSGQPVYDLRVHWVAGNPSAQAGAEDQLGTLGPQAVARTERTVPATTATEQFTAIAYFRDAAGMRWTLTPDGHLAPVDAALAAGAPLIAISAAAQSQSGAR